MAKSEAFLAFNEITEQHNLPREVVLDALRQALVSAYQKDSGIGKNQPVTADVDAATNRYVLYVEKEVVETITPPRRARVTDKDKEEDAKLTSSKTEIRLDEAQKIKPDAQVGDMIMALVENKSESFGRIAAQTAKQVILQKIRDAERRMLYQEFIGREGEIVTAIVTSVAPSHVTVSLGGKAEAIMPAKEQLRDERYSNGEKIKVYIMEVKESTKGPQITVSRAHRNMLRRMFEDISPEVHRGLVEIRAIVRDPGLRAKIAVIATQPGIDALGACVGSRGERIQDVVRELNGERIDVIRWNADPRIFVKEALSPAKEIVGVYLERDPELGDTATVIVPDSQLTVAIGKAGQNARLAAKLTGWRIDIKKVSVAAMEAYALLDSPALAEMRNEYTEMLMEVDRIVTKKQRDPDTNLPSDEMRTLERFVQVAEERLVAARELDRANRQKALERVRAAVPQFAFMMDLKELELANDIIAPLRSIKSVGDLIVLMLGEPEELERKLTAGGAQSDAMDAIRDAVDVLVLERQAAIDSGEIAAPEMPAPPVTADTAEVTATITVPDEISDEDAPPAFPDVSPVTVERRPSAQPEPYRARFERPEYQGGATDATEIDITQGGKNKKKEKAKGAKKDRDLVFDERAGRTVAHKKYKAGREGDWTAEVEDLDLDAYPVNSATDTADIVDTTDLSESTEPNES